MEGRPGAASTWPSGAGSAACQANLAYLLDEPVAPRPVAGRAALTVELILAWADRHKERTGNYPHAKSGLVEDAPGETWHHIDSALRRGYRGLPGNDTLARLLRRHGRGKRGRGRPCGVTR